MREWIFRHSEGLGEFRDNLAAFVEDVKAMTPEERAAVKSETRGEDLVMILPDLSGEAVAAELMRFAVKQLD